MQTAVVASPPARPPDNRLDDARSAIPRWQEVRRFLTNAVYTHRFAPNQLLPSAKNLCGELGITHATLTKALVSLMSEGAIARYRRGYRVTTAVSAVSDATIAVIAAGFDRGWHVRATPFSAELWRRIEHECLHRGLKLEALTAAEAVGRGKRSMAAIRRERRIAGFLLLPLNIPSDTLAVLTGLLREAGLPAAILDETGSVEPSLVRHAKALRLFSMANGYSAGGAVARYLLDCGHRSVAFVTADPGDRISAQRLAGLTGAFERAGFPGVVTTAHPRPVVDFEKTLNEMPAYRKFRGRILNESRTMMKKFSAARREIEVDGFTFPLVQYESMVDTFRPILAALRKTAATAWVCFNDELALLAIDFLDRSGARIPRDLSVVGFDDTLDAFTRGLTSYNFNVPAMVNAVFEHLLAPAHASSACPIEVPGYVVPRMSSGYARSFSRT